MMAYRVRKICRVLVVPGSSEARLWKLHCAGRAVHRPQRRIPSLR